MGEKEQLAHDLIILRAKYILYRDYNKIKADLEILAELQEPQAMGYFAVIHDIGYNKFIDSLIDEYPKCSTFEIFLRRAASENSEELDKAQVRATRDQRYKFVNFTPEQILDKILFEGAMLSDNRTASDLKKYVDASILHPEDDDDSNIVHLIASLIGRGEEIPLKGKMALLAIASQPYSDTFEDFKAEKLRYEQQTEENQ